MERWVNGSGKGIQVLIVVASGVIRRGQLLRVGRLLDLASEPRVRVQFARWIRLELVVWRSKQNPFRGQVDPGGAVGLGRPRVFAPGAG